MEGRNANAEKNYDNIPCPNCRGPHRLWKCSGPPDRYGYLPRCGKCKTLNHHLADCLEGVKRRDLKHFIFRGRTGKPPAVWDTDFLDQSLRALVANLPWTRQFCREQLAKNGATWNDTQLHDPALESADFDVARIGRQIHPSITDRRSDEQGNIKAKRNYSRNNGHSQQRTSNWPGSSGQGGMYQLPPPAPNNVPAYRIRCISSRIPNGGRPSNGS